MGTVRIGVSRTSPSTAFYLEADVIATDGVGNGRWLIQFYLRAVNTGNSDSRSGGYGEQLASMNGGHQGGHYANPFLPAGYANGQQRWNTGWTYWVSANAQGYWNSTMTTIPLAMTLNYDGGSTVYTGSMELPRLATVPGAPTALGATARTDTTMALSWTAPVVTGGSAISGYDIEYSTSASFLGATLLSQGWTVSRTITGLAPTTLYYFRIRAKNGSGSSAWSAVYSQSTLGLPGVPATPVLVDRTATAINLTTTDPSYVGEGVLERVTQLSTSSTFATIHSERGTNTPSWTGLTRNTQYYARYRVRNSIGWSVWSGTLSVQTLVQKPSAPTGYAISDLTSTTAYVTTPAVADNGGAPLTDIRVRYQQAGDPTVYEFSTGGYLQPFLSELTPGASYTLQLAVNNGGPEGLSDWGPALSFTARTNVPTPPRSFGVSSITNNSAQFSWVAPLNLLGATLFGYSLRVASNPGFSQSLQVISLSATTLTRTVDGLLPGTRYYAQVWSTSSNGVGSYSSVISFVTSGTAPAPDEVWVRLSGTWRAGRHWIKVGETWRLAKMWQKVGDTWRRG